MQAIKFDGDRGLVVLFYFSQTLHCITSIYWWEYNL